MYCLVCSSLSSVVFVCVLYIFAFYYKCPGRFELDISLIIIMQYANDDDNHDIRCIHLDMFDIGGCSP